jgi:GNAT superfamily N-acetyltransferase
VVSVTELRITTPTPADLATLLMIWEAQRRRNAITEASPWRRAIAERRITVEALLRRRLDGARDNTPAFLSWRDEYPIAYLLGSEMQLPRTSGYRAYAPDHFINIGPEEWALADPEESAALDALYAALAAWGLERGVGAQLLSIPEGDDLTDTWLDLGFARHDRYAYLPIATPIRPAKAGVQVRRATVADVAAATHFNLAEAHHHHLPPIFAFAPPGRDEARQRDIATNLAEAESLFFIAEANGRALGGLSAFFNDTLPFWMPSATPTPCTFIDSAFVEPEARGHGVLRALVTALRAETMARGGVGLFVTYLPANRSAHLAWERLGFDPLITVHQRRLDPRTVRQYERKKG